APVAQAVQQAGRSVRHETRPAVKFPHYDSIILLFICYALRRAGVACHNPIHLANYFLAHNPLCGIDLLVGMPSATAQMVPRQMEKMVRGALPRLPRLPPPPSANGC